MTDPETPRDETCEHGTALDCHCCECGRRGFAPPSCACGYFGSAPIEEAMNQSEDAAVVNAVTAAMREADRLFQAVGGSTRHHVRDCLLPILNRAGWVVQKANGQ